jgi:pimeloyl-ACP methyl ester carboxylesterase
MPGAVSGLAGACKLPPVPRAAVSPGIELEYEVFGDAGAPTLVLVMGFGAQMIFWDTRFCEAIAARGFRVVRFDNRDIGLSTKLRGTPDFSRAMMGDRSAATYAIEDMADDLGALIPLLGVAAAHVVGASMGGFIVQEAAIRHPARLLSMTSIMSSTGDRKVGQPRPDALGALLTPPPPDREGSIERAVVLWRTIGSPGFPFDEAAIRLRAGRVWDRDHDTSGIIRQAAAIFSQRDRTADLGKVQLPALVIHGAEDPLITVSGGEATARAIPGARLLVVPGMGHDVPEPAWPAMIDAIVDNAHRAGA